LSPSPVSCREVIVIFHWCPRDFSIVDDFPDETSDRILPRQPSFTTGQDMSFLFPAVSNFISSDGFGLDFPKTPFGNKLELSQCPDSLGGNVIRWPTRSSFPHAVQSSIPLLLSFWSDLLRCSVTPSFFTLSSSHWGGP